MNPYIIPIVCSICGGEGLMDASEGYGADWLYDFRHRNPEICAINLSRQRDNILRYELAKKELEK